jgi:23S rRNA C2498 (ribose-2'-O)-methylase RlmM
MTRAVKQHVPLNIELVIYEQEQINSLKESVEFKTFIFKHVLISIKDAIKNKLNEAKILNVVNFNYTLIINKTQFKDILNTILKLYEEQEEYLECKEITKLIKKYEK